MKFETIYLRKDPDGVELPWLPHGWRFCEKDDPGAVLFTNELSEDDRNIVIISDRDGVITARCGLMEETMLGYGAQGFSRRNYVDAYRGLAYDLYERSNKRREETDMLKAQIAKEESRIRREKKWKAIEKHGGWWNWVKAGRPID